MAVKCLITEDSQENTYVYSDDRSLQAVIIDPGMGMEKTIDYIDTNNLIPVAILLTHAHIDHIEGVPELKEKYNIPLLLHVNEVKVLQNPKYNLSEYIGKKAFQLFEDGTFSDYEVYSFGDDKKITVIPTPGHTSGGVCYYSQQDHILFSGDTLFYSSVGRTDLELGNSKDLLKSIKENLLVLPDETKVYPGHGMSTTIIQEKENNPYIGDFIWNF